MAPAPPTLRTWPAPPTRPTVIGAPLPLLSSSHPEAMSATSMSTAFRPAQTIRPTLGSGTSTAAPGRTVAAPGPTGGAGATARVGVPGPLGSAAPTTAGRSGAPTVSAPDHGAAISAFGSLAPTPSRGSAGPRWIRRSGAGRVHPAGSTDATVRTPADAGPERMPREPLGRPTAPQRRPTLAQ
ncbi:MAG: hypothetical protein ABI243_01925, partial [Lapillicoccus sp.]